MIEPEPSASLDHEPPDPPTPTESAPPEASVTEAIESLPSQLQPQLERQSEPPQPQAMEETIARVDDGWRQFRAAAGAFPSERMDERLNDGWTRKQMLAHISAWHDLTHDRLGKMILNGKPEESVEDADKFNARVARQAVGRTAGEILKEMEMTFNRLRRQLGRLTDEQLAAYDGWAAHIIASNTYEHYEEHWADVYMPPPPDGRSSRR